MAGGFRGYTCEWFLFAFLIQSLMSRLVLETVSYYGTTFNCGLHPEDFSRELSTNVQSKCLKSRMSGHEDGQSGTEGPASDKYVSTHWEVGKQRPHLIHAKTTKI